MGIILSALVAFSALAGQTSLETTIEALLTEVEQSECTFIRNGKEHTAKEAVKHMRKKYDHFNEKGKIKTPEDFIKYSATKSLMSKKPYKIRTKEGQEMPSKTFMLNLLKKHRESE